jgi:hypothetical protein
MLYFPLLDVCFQEYAPIMARLLCQAGQAVENPPHRPCGYATADHDERLYRLLFRRACDMNARRVSSY